MSTPRPRDALPLLFLALTACAHAPGPAHVEPQPGAPEQRSEAPWYGDLRALAEEAARARGLVLTQAFEIVPLDEEAFLREYRAIAEQQNGDLLRELARTLAAFDLTRGERPMFGAEIADQAKEVQAEQILAFYHFPTHRLVVRRALPPLASNADETFRLSVLAHEVGHVLQDQLGAFHANLGTFEASLAHRAVLEGDASLTATLVLGARKGHTAARAVERSRVTLQALSGDDLLELGGFSPKLLAASPVLRTLFLFPYLRGQRFMADLFQAGGLELVNAVLAAPPRRSDAVLSPQRWLDGRPARLVPLDAADGHLGALLVRVFFEQCLAGQADLAPRARAEVLSWVEERYEDDSFLVDDGTLVWTTAWAPEPTETQGRGTGRAEEAMRMLAGCLGDGEPGVAARAGTVALALGGAGPGRRALADRAVATPRKRADEPPFGPRKVPDVSLVVAFRAAGPGVLGEDGTWLHPRLGLSLTIPPGSRLVENLASTLTLSAAEGAVLTGALVDEEPTTKSDDAFVNAVLRGLFEAAHLGTEGLSLGRTHAWTPLDLGWAKARDASSSFPVPSGMLRVRGRVIPICGGQASFNIVGIAFRDEAMPLIETWLAALKGTSESPPLCAEK